MSTHHPLDDADFFVAAERELSRQARYLTGASLVMFDWPGPLTDTHVAALVREIREHDLSTTRAGAEHSWLLAIHADAAAGQRVARRLATVLRSAGVRGLIRWRVAATDGQRLALDMLDGVRRAPEERDEP